MRKTSLKWVSKRTFVGTDSHNHSVVLSGDDPAVGVSPAEMLLVALSACSAYDVVAILEKKRKKLTLLEVAAEGEMGDEPPFAYRTIHLTYLLSGEGLSEAAVRQAIDLSHEKYCSVAATVKGVAEVTTAFEII
jgi:putative redox protein